MTGVVFDNAKVMSKGQTTLPKYIRMASGDNTGDRVACICDGDRVIKMNAAFYIVAGVPDCCIVADYAHDGMRTVFHRKFPDKLVKPAV